MNAPLMTLWTTQDVHQLPPQMPKGHLLSQAALQNTNSSNHQPESRKP